MPVSAGFGRRLAEARVAKDLSQNALAKIMETTNITISRHELETAQPRRSNLNGYIRTLGVTEEWLRFGHGADPANKKLIAQYLATPYGVGCSPAMAAKLCRVPWAELGVRVPTMPLIHDMRMALERHHEDP